MQHWFTEFLLFFLPVKLLSSMLSSSRRVVQYFSKSEDATRYLSSSDAFFKRTLKFLIYISFKRCSNCTHTSAKTTVEQTILFPTNDLTSMTKSLYSDFLTNQHYFFNSKVTVLNRFFQSTVHESLISVNTEPSAELSNSSCSWMTSSVAEFLKTGSVSSLRLDISR